MAWGQGVLILVSTLEQLAIYAQAGPSSLNLISLSIGACVLKFQTANLQMNFKYNSLENWRCIGYIFFKITVKDSSLVKRYKFVCFRTFVKCLLYGHTYMEQSKKIKETISLHVSTDVKAEGLWWCNQYGDSGAVPVFYL